MFKKGKSATCNVKTGQTKARAPRNSDNDADDKRGIKNRAMYFDNDPDDMRRSRNGGKKK
jgi:hypothetical protein